MFVTYPLGLSIGKTEPLRGSESIIQIDSQETKANSEPADRSLSLFHPEK